MDLLQRSAGDIPAEYAEQANTLLCEDRTVIGHLAAYTRPVLVGRGKLTIGLIGGWQLRHVIACAAMRVACWRKHMLISDRGRSPSRCFSLLIRRYIDRADTVQCGT